MDIQFEWKQARFNSEGDRKLAKFANVIFGKQSTQNSPSTNGEASGFRGFKFTYQPASIQREKKNSSVTSELQHRFERCRRG
ncbi:hypothetical protein LEP1GSC098_1875 [Leptospira interrogans serovar Grippotyphosa str. UI 08434]|nr:hypothetical protein LEP1GSC098_1875 [Leptospira interrogans serovar Grippotyphosa str. UI 08434]